MCGPPVETYLAMSGVEASWVEKWGSCHLIVIVIESDVTMSWCATC